MQIIVRMTTRCNFKCTMCSASNLSNNHDLQLSKIIEILNRYNTQPNNICFEGGDPLCIKPRTYHELFRLIDQDRSISINEYGFTTNLWEFYKHPLKWINIFKRQNVGVCTSFQFGDRRRITANKVYDVDTFTSVVHKFEDLVNKSVPFIAVIDNDNQDSVLQTVQLAKQLNTTCKINPLFVAGRSTSFYRWDNMLDKYCDIFEAELEQYESNCTDIIRLILGKPLDLNCPWIRNCGDKFVVVSPDGWLSSCSIDGSNRYSQLQPIKFYDHSGVSNITLDNSRYVISGRCLTCDHYDWCNSCRVKIGEMKMFTKNQHDLDVYCERIDRSVRRLTAFVKQRYENNSDSSL